MGDDDLLRRLGALEREYDADFPHEWEAVVAGTQDPAAAAAAREGADTPEEAALFAEMFRPLGDAEVDAIAGRLARALAEGPPPAPVAVDAARPTAEPSPPAPLAIDLAAQRRRRRFIGGGGLLAVAAALALWIRQGGEGPPPADDPLAPYALVVRNEEVRSDRSVGAAGPADAARYRLDSRIHWVLSPDEAVSAPERLRVRVWASDGASTLTIDPTTGVTVAQSGVVELRGILGEILPLEPGRWSLRFGIGPDVASDPEAAADDPRSRVVGPYTVTIDK